MPDVSKSPFFRPREKPDITQTPGGTKRLRQKSKEEVEHKSTLLGCAANLINAIVGSGIVGIPYAIQQAGFVSGVFLVIACAFLTEKSLRLLIETAKHVHVPSYETVAEAAFGRYGFLFVAANMLIMAYGAMLSYLMIVKDTFSYIFGVDPENQQVRRAILFIISVTIMVPLSSQRDMADLAKTSRINATFDLIMVMIVVYCAPIRESLETFDWRESIIEIDTIFVGMGVLSFAFVCQHSAFIIAGSFENPTRSRWASVTQIALTFAGCLALMCGLGGFLGFQENTKGNILNSLDENSLPANVARGLLGTTMLFVYPMESFVARHACVVLFFQGRKAHEGDDTSVLNRRDRRVTLTIVLYLIAVIPAALFEDLGFVLAASGAVGGGSLAYVGPGAVYLGVHGARFLELTRSFFGEPIQPERETNEETIPLYNTGVAKDLTEPERDSCIMMKFKTILWYLMLMPIWTRIASFGKAKLTHHVEDLVLKSPNPIRIGNVRFATAEVSNGPTRVVLLPKRGSTVEDQQLNAPTDTMLLRADSVPKIYAAPNSGVGQMVALPLSPHRSKVMPHFVTDSSQKDYQSINQKIGAMARRKKKEEALALEDDPQQNPPKAFDFVIAIFYIVFGVVSMFAGLWSLFLEIRGTRE